MQWRCSKCQIEPTASSTHENHCYCPFILFPTSVAKLVYTSQLQIEPTSSSPCTICNGQAWNMHGRTLLCLEDSITGYLLHSTSTPPAKCLEPPFDLCEPCDRPIFGPCTPPDPTRPFLGPVSFSEPPPPSCLEASFSTRPRRRLIASPRPRRRRVRPRRPAECLRPRDRRDQLGLPLPGRHGQRSLWRGVQGGLLLLRLLEGRAQGHGLH